MPNLKKVLVILAAFFFVLILLPSYIADLAGLYIDWLWFKEIGFEELFTKPIIYNGLIHLVIFLSSFVFIYLLLSFVGRELVKFGINPPSASRSRKILLTITGVALFLGWINSLLDSGLSFTYLNFANATPFGIRDPILQNDLSFFVFNLPLMQEIFDHLYNLIFWAGVATAVHLLLSLWSEISWKSLPGNKSLDRAGPNWIGSAKIVLPLLLSAAAFVVAFFLPLSETIWPVYFLILFYLFSKLTARFLRRPALEVSRKPSAWPGYLRRASVFIKPFGFLVVLSLLIYAARVLVVEIPSLVYSGNEVIPSGAGFTDINIKLPYLQFLPIVLILSSIWMLFTLFRLDKLITGKTSFNLIKVLGGPFVLLILYASFWGVAQEVVQKYFVKPNEFEKESSYIASHIDLTKKAWGVDRVGEVRVSGTATVNSQDVIENKSTFQNVRLWNREQLLQVFQQTQALRTYYSFKDVDDDRYMVDGKYRQVMISARELNLSGLNLRTFIGDRIIYTHGFGATAVTTAEKTPEGLPKFTLKDIPPLGIPATTRPQLYFGEGEGGYMLVNAKSDGLDYPAAEKDVYAPYQGEAGIKVDSFMRRLLFSIALGDVNILFTDQITPETKVVLYRNVSDRISKAFKYIATDTDPYIVVDDQGKMHWIVDGYTETAWFPYSLNIDGRNYLRNSVKFVIDAFSGKIRAYVSDPSDPIINTYAKIFPGVFSPIEEMGQDLRAHIRYPSYLFAKQAEVYSTYHMDTRSFYSDEDQWNIPLEDEQEYLGYLMRHFVMRLPGEAKEEFIFVVPFTPNGKANLISWLAARNDGEHYGQLIDFRLPKETLIYGPDQVRARIDQDSQVAQQITLWSQAGARVIRGSVFTIPVNDAFFYVQPLYLQALGENRIPELRAVIMAYQNKIVMAESVAEALDKLFPGVKSEIER